MSFQTIFDHVLHRIKGTTELPPSTWQSMDISDKPHMATHELLNYSLEYGMDSENLEHYRADIKPNLPWADVHFEEERSSGQPINPGESWKQWPGASSAATMIRDQGQYDHSYAERYWPKLAGLTPDGHITEADRLLSRGGSWGIRFQCGDLDDLVKVLCDNPDTRQAYLPIWFPEDLTAARISKRVPCTLGYHFIMRSGHLHVNYYMRSCDIIRHFRDDVYLTVRLALWVLKECQKQGALLDVKPGTLTMHITSLHMFKADYKRIFR